jgi:hypothetical protein
VKIDNREMSRKEFFRACLRYMILLGFALYGYFQFKKSRNPASGNQVCGNNGICSGCGELKDCGLPQARSMKAYKKKVEG